MTQVRLQPDHVLVGKEIRIRRLRFADLPEMAAWEAHTNPLLATYNLHFDSPSKWRRWLERRLQSRWAYALRNSEGELVGHFSLRQIDHPRSARLGITIAAAFTRRGYGQAALCTFLDHFFGELGFEEMRLDVSGANLAARHLYQKLGFKHLFSFWLSALYYPEEIQLQDERAHRHFRKGKEQYFEMRLKADRWWRVRVSLSRDQSKPR